MSASRAMAKWSQFEAGEFDALPSGRHIHAGVKAERERVGCNCDPTLTLVVRDMDPNVDIDYAHEEHCALIQAARAAAAGGNQ